MKFNFDREASKHNKCFVVTINGEELTVEVAHFEDQRMYILGGRWMVNELTFQKFIRGGYPIVRQGI